jgi:hypothetical protein
LNLHDSEDWRQSKTHPAARENYHMIGMIYRLPILAELHIHLEGSIEPEALRQIDPSLTAGEIAENTRYEDFAGFIASYAWLNRKLLTPQHYRARPPLMPTPFALGGEESHKG